VRDKDIEKRERERKNMKKNSTNRTKAESNESVDRPLFGNSKKSWDEFFSASEAGKYFSS